LNNWQHPTGNQPKAARAANRGSGDEMINYESKTIGTIGNYYGELEIRKENGKYFWGIYSWGGCNWEEITEELYKALVKYENQRISSLADSDIVSSFSM